MKKYTINFKDLLRKMIFLFVYNNIFDYSDIPKNDCINWYKTVNEESINLSILA